MPLLAFSFATYGLMKNRVRMPALESLSVETALLLVPAVAVLAVLESRGTATFGHTALGTNLLLVGVGILTAVPLLLFGAAASRVPLSTMGLMQYITPTLQFMIGLLVVLASIGPMQETFTGLLAQAFDFVRTLHTVGN